MKDKKDKPQSTGLARPILWKPKGMTDEEFLQACKDGPNESNCKQ